MTFRNFFNKPILIAPEYPLSVGAQSGAFFIGEYER